MNEKKLRKLQVAKDTFDSLNLNYFEYENGHLQVDGINFWDTSEKWYDNCKTKGGKGLNSFLQHLKELKII